MSFLRCRIAIANNNIVAGQCAEYCASSVYPKRPSETEYNKQINANNIG